MLQKRAIRSMMGMKQTDSWRPIFRDLKILTMISLYILEMSLHIFKNKCKYQRVQDTHNLNTRSKVDFHIGYSRLAISRNLPEYIGLKIFNSLPAELKTLKILTSFKNRLNAFYSLDEFINFTR